MHGLIDIDNVENAGVVVVGGGSGCKGKKREKRERRDINLQAVNGGNSCGGL